MGKEEGDDGDRGGGGGAFKITSSWGADSTAEAAAEAATKAMGGDGDNLHPSQFPDPPPKLSLSDDNDEDEDGDNDDENGGDGKFGRNGERGGDICSGGMAPAEDSVAALSSDCSDLSASAPRLRSASMLFRPPLFSNVKSEKTRRAGMRRRAEDDHEEVKMIHWEEEEEAPTGWMDGAP